MFKTTIETNKKYDLIYADPPWQYRNNTPVQGAAEKHYPTMSQKELTALNVPDICKKDCILYLWVTYPCIQEGLELINAWKFKYKSQYVWVKPSIGTGYWVRSQHELLMIAIRGKVPCPDKSLRKPSAIFAKRRKHSQKPEIVANIIEEHHPNAEKIELFARQARYGWDVWGNEVDNTHLFQPINPMLKE